MRILYLLVLITFMNLIGSEIEEIKISDPLPMEGPDVTKMTDDELDDWLKKLKKNTDFFKEIMGIDEKLVKDLWQKNKKAYNNIIKKSFVDPQREKIKEELAKVIRVEALQDIILNYEERGLRNPITDQLFQVGKFASFTLDELRKVDSNSNKGRFNVMAALNTTEFVWFKDIITMAKLQTKKENRDAIFQVMSLANVLENTDYNYDIEKNGVSGYFYAGMSPQSPDTRLTSLSAAPGLIYRMYYIFYPDKTPDLWRQTNTKQVNLLDLLPDEYPVENGNINFYKQIENDKSKFYKSGPDIDIGKIFPLNIDIGKVKLGYLSNIQVTYSSYESSFFYDLSQTINQVYTPIVYGNKDLYTYRKVIQKAQALIIAAYEGAIRLAILMNKKKLFLSFPYAYLTRISWVSDAILRNKDIIKKSNLDITLVIENLLERGMELEKFKKQMVELTEYCEGKFLIYKNDGIYELKTSKKDINLKVNIDNFYSLYNQISILNNIL